MTCPERSGAYVGWIPGTAAEYALRSALTSQYVSYPISLGAIDLDLGFGFGFGFNFGCV